MKLLLECKECGVIGECPVECSGHINNGYGGFQYMLFPVTPPKEFQGSSSDMCKDCSRIFTINQKLKLAELSKEVEIKNKERAVKCSKNKKLLKEELTYLNEIFSSANNIDTKEKARLRYLVDAL